MATHSPVFFPGESHAQRSLSGYNPWGGKASEKTEQLHYWYYYGSYYHKQIASQMAPWVKNLPEMQEIQEMWVWSLGQEYPLEKEMEIHSSILDWKIPWTEEPGRLQSKGL